MNRILFVCAGNICRSPVVEAVSRAEFARAGVDIDLASAGTGAWHVGHAADIRAQASAAASGYDLAPHRARRVDDADFARYDWVLAMDRDNLRELQQRCPPAYAARVALFLPFAGIDQPQEVPDPYYGGTQDFARVIELAQAGARGLITRLTLA